MNIHLWHKWYLLSIRPGRYLYRCRQCPAKKTVDWISK